jgi:hypothetical protein
MQYPPPGRFAILANGDAIALAFAKGRIPPQPRVIEVGPMKLYCYQPHKLALMSLLPRFGFPPVMEIEGISDARCLIGTDRSGVFVELTNHPIRVPSGMIQISREARMGYVGVSDAWCREDIRRAA